VNQISVASARYRTQKDMVSYPKRYGIVSEPTQKSSEMNKYPLINDAGVFVGTSMQWDIRDVERLTGQTGITLSEQDLKKVLTSALDDNDWLMEKISDAISETMYYLLEEKLIKNLEQ
jgi:hypothetical protein